MKQNAPSRSPAFTLIELLVVITIIVVLLALLTPAMDRAMDRAVETVCGARLHAWSGALAQYASDHRNRMMITPQYFQPPIAYPSHPYMYGTVHPGEWSVEASGPYVAGYDPTGTSGMPEIWRCPASSIPWSDQQYNDAVKHGRGPTGGGHEGVFIQSHYMLFAGVEIWGKRTDGVQVANQPQDLAGRRLGSQGLLMADSIYYWSGSGGIWLYNHDEYRQTGVPMITGTSQLFGDGSVRWVDDDVFTPAANEQMTTRNPPENIHWTSHNGATTGDLHYYAWP